jgi:hypothetical protein
VIGSVVRAGAVAGAVFVLGMLTPAVAADVDAGLLRPKDVGLPQASAPHTADLIRASQVPPATCEDPETRDYAGRRVAFAGKGAAASGPSLNEYVLDFGSTAQSADTFSALKADTVAQRDCGDTEFGKIVSLSSAPKGVGEARYTFVTKPRIGGAQVLVTEIGFRKGSHVGVLVFVSWPKSKPTPAAIAKQAAKLLA